MDDQFITAGDGDGGVGTMINHFSPQKVDFSTDRKNQEFKTSQSHRRSLYLV